MIWEELHRIDTRAEQLAVRQKSAYITLEHLFLALMKEPVIQEILKAYSVDTQSMKKGLKPLLGGIPRQKQTVTAPVCTMAYARTRERACNSVTDTGRDRVTAADLLVSLFDETEAQVVYLLKKVGLSRFKLVSYLTQKEAGSAEGEAAPDENIPEADPLETYAVNLTEKARSGGIDPLIGRKNEMFRISCILSRRKKNNPILVGEPGVGKTAIVEGLAHSIEKGRIVGYSEDFEMFALDLGSLMAGTMFRGMVEQRLKGLLKQLRERPNAVLFIDEIHMIVGAGAPAGSAMDVANLLKPLLASGELRVVGATTSQEYKQFFETDKALSRRFQKVQVSALTKEQTLRVLQGLLPKYESFHEVTYSKRSLELAVELADRYLKNHHFPDKAIDIIDEAGALLKRFAPKKSGKEWVVGEAVINQVISTMAGVPQHKLSETELGGYRNLEVNLKKQVFGQDHAIGKMCDALIMSRAGLVQQESPIGCFLCVGPPGVGKTSLARSIAGELDIHFERFDMSEYLEEHTVSRLIGSPPGYEGHNQGGLLTEAIGKHPHSVLLMDEIEKAHPKIFNIFLQVMDYGTLTDSSGIKVDFKNVVFIMTSNVGSAQKRAIGINNHQAGSDKLDDAVKDAFSAEFLNRLTEVVSFKHLDSGMIGKIVDKALKEIQTSLGHKNLTMEITEAAKAWLVQHGHVPESGARPVRNLVKSQILNPLSKKILLEGFAKGTVLVALNPQETDLTIECR
ncbi:MAG: AAA domain-containing protein [Proteobacteria bacterium]|nr:AAA domain-containing protein [Pseudomonadota bacterium]